METGQDILFQWVARMIVLGLYVTGEVLFKTVNPCTVWFALKTAAK